MRFENQFSNELLPVSMLFPFYILSISLPLYACHLCSDVSSDGLKCEFNSTCRYGRAVNVMCRSVSNASDSIHLCKTICRYCHQLTEKSDFSCKPPSSECAQPGVARSYYVAQCHASPTVVCMGHREFLRMLPCVQESGKSYGTTVMLSLFLGGLGADRFYLGMWREGLGKLFTFGGLGVWSVVDFILVVVGYICPPDDITYWRNAPPM
ncbi:TM2 [Echinococcus multilocularis]|uniref:TM2 n=1 Tax=Echinococcus multilocularis TaxID=6211 RepID=A0A068YKK8_ECHMU|nr:TM2 [Echinococcus multilocularis]